MPVTSNSEIFLKGIKWLEDEIRYDRMKLETELKTIDEQLDAISTDLASLGNSAEDILQRQKLRSQKFDLEWKRDNNIEPHLELEYGCKDAESFYILKKVGSDLLNNFIRTAENPDFWDDSWLLEDSHILWYFKKLGFDKNPHFADQIDSLLKSQSVEGYIQSNELDHAGPMRVLVAARPKSKQLQSAVEYWLKNWRGSYPKCPEIVSVGILALTELDSELFSDCVREQTDHLKKLQNKNGSWESYATEESDQGSIDTTAFAISAIARVDGIKNDYSQRGLEWILSKQQGIGKWEDVSDTTSALRALLTMGHGPEIPCELMELELMRLDQNHSKSRPIFVHTSPLYHSSLHVKEINDKISNMISKAKKEIRMTSPFVDMFYEDLIDVCQKNPELKLKLITRPKSEIEGLREKIAKNVVDLLNTVARGNVVQSRIVHSRMVIIDDTEVLVSSADLTRDQLFDEFNAGIWTADKETVAKAIDFFENIFELEKEQSKK